MSGKNNGSSGFTDVNSASPKVLFNPNWVLGFWHVSIFVLSFSKFYGCKDFYQKWIYGLVIMNLLVLGSSLGNQKLFIYSVFLVNFFVT